jgi:protein phosphatase
MANTATLNPSVTPDSPPDSSGESSSAPLRHFAMLSHPGQIRHANQDACAALPEIGAFVICDGVGGAAAGEVASHLATEAFLNSLAHPARTPKAAPTGQPNGLHPAHHPHTRLLQAVRAANHAVFQRAQRSRALRGMGTTLVALLWEDSSDASVLWLAHVGDSRCYLFRQGILRLLTQDHSLVEEQVRAGQLTRAQAESSPIRNIITRAVGTQPTVEPDIAAHAVQPGDLILLASDGLTRELQDAAISLILADASAANLDATSQALIDAANTAGGRDNITVLLVACP